MPFQVQSTRWKEVYHSFDWRQSVVEDPSNLILPDPQILVVYMGTLPWGDHFDLVPALITKTWTRSFPNDSPDTPHTYFPPKVPAPSSQLPPMSSLIEGFFEVIDPRVWGDDIANTATSSPQRDKSYLTLYDSYFGLGSDHKTWLPCELRLYSPDEDLSDKVIHVHGRFVVVPSSAETDPCIKIEVYCFISMSDFVQEEKNIRFSITFYGRVYQHINAPQGSNNKIFSVEVSEYVRDRSQTYIIR